MTPGTAARQASLSITQFSEFTQTHVHRVGDATQPSHPLLSPSPLAPIPPSIRVFSNKSTLRMSWPSTGVSALRAFFPWFSKLSISLVIIPRAQSRKQSYKLNMILLTLSHIQDWPADPVSKTTDFDSVDLECGLRFSISNKLPGVVVLLSHGPHTRKWPGCKQHCAWIQVTRIFCFSISLSPVIFKKSPTI